MNHHMNAMNMQMRSMNRLMNSFMPDPFNMLGPSPFDPGFQQGALMERSQQAMAPMGGGLFGFPPMPSFNRLLNAGTYYEICDRPRSIFDLSVLQTLALIMAHHFAKAP